MESDLAKVTVVAGMPTPQGRVSRTGLPGTTTNFVKLLREQGFEVDVAVPRKDREYVDLNSAEVWLPVLEFAIQPVWDLTVLCLVGAIKSFFARRKVDGDEEIQLPQSELHFKCSFEGSDGSRLEFEAHGTVDDVVKSLKEFDKIE